MKKIIVTIIVTLFFLGLYSESFCARGGSRGGGPPGGGPRIGGPPPGGGPPRGGPRFGGPPRGGHHHYYGGGPRVFIGGYFGFPYYGFPYYAYPYPYYPYGPVYYPSYPYYPYASEQATVHVETEQPYYWYYCADPEGYYPYVRSCPGGWARVIPTPSEKEDAAK